MRSSKLAGGAGSSKAAKASRKTAAQQEDDDELDLDTYEEDDAHGYEVRAGGGTARRNCWLGRMLVRFRGRNGGWVSAAVVGTDIKEAVCSLRLFEQTCRHI